MPLGSRLFDHLQVQTFNQAALGGPPRADVKDYVARIHPCVILQGLVADDVNILVIHDDSLRISLLVDFLQDLPELAVVVRFVHRVAICVVQLDLVDHFVVDQE